MADSEYIWQITSAITQALNADLLLVGRNPNNPVITVQNLGASLGLATNVKMFGALGVGTDDTDAINSAIAATAAGGYLYFPPGTYLTQGTAITKQLTVTFAPGATLKLVNAAALNSKLLNIQAANVTVTGRGTLDGNKAAQTNTGIDVVYNDGYDGFILELVNVINSKEYGIHLVDASDCLLRRVLASAHTLDAVWVQAFSKSISDVAIKDSIIDASAADRVCVNFVGTDAWAMNGCEVSGNTLTGASGGTKTVLQFYGGGSNNRLCKNNLTYGYTAISVANNGTSGESFVVVEGNTVTAPVSIGIELVGGAKMSALGNTVNGNAVTAVGISLNGNGSTAYRNLSAIGNTVAGCITAGIQVYFAHYSVVTGNNVDLQSGTPKGIYFQGSNHCQGGANVLNGPNAAGSVGLYATDDSSHLNLDGNIYDNWGWHVQLVGTTSYDYISQAGGSMGTFVTGYAQAGGVGAGSHISFTGIPEFSSGVFAAADILDLANLVLDGHGNGVPEGAATAGVRSTFFQDDGVAGAQSWRKTSGTGNTGWQLVNEAFAAATGSRPTLGTAHADFTMFDTTLGKPIWWTGTGWVDATGGAV